MALVCEAAKSRDLGEAFVRIIRQQPLCAANAIIRLPLSDGHTGRVPKCAAKSLGRDLSDLSQRFDGDGLPQIIPNIPRDRVPIGAGQGSGCRRVALCQLEHGRKQRLRQGEDERH